MYRVQREIPVGKWRVIENCQMNPAGGQFRATRHPYKMSILYETVVIGSGLDYDRIFLSLADYENIGSVTKKELPYLIGTLFVLI